MATGTFKVTVHMVSSVDAIIARKDNSVSWFETSDYCEKGVTEPNTEEFLKTIDCYLMGARTYEHALEPHYRRKVITNPLQKKNCISILERANIFSKLLNLSSKIFLTSIFEFFLSVSHTAAQQKFLLPAGREKTLSSLVQIH